MAERLQTARWTFSRSFAQESSVSLVESIVFNGQDAAGNLENTYETKFSPGVAKPVGICRDLCLLVEAKVVDYGIRRSDRFVHTLSH
jgi:hypothetical protein